MILFLVLLGSERAWANGVFLDYARRRIEETLNLQSYGHSQCCHLCRATKSGDMAYYNHSATAPWRAAGAVTFEEYRELALGNNRRIPYLSIPGFRHTLVAIDDMHVNDQGFCLRATGSTLVWLCQNGYFGPAPMRLQLIRAHNIYKQWCVDTKQESRLIQFTEENLHLGLHKFVFLTGKAADARHFAGFTYDVIRASGRAPNVDETEYNLVLGVAWGLRKYYLVEYTTGRWLDDEALLALQSAAICMLTSFTAIHVRLGQPGYFRPKPKDHQLMHLVTHWCEITRINPRFCSNYKNENFVRLMKRFAATCFWPAPSTSNIFGSSVLDVVCGVDREIFSWFWGP